MSEKDIKVCPWCDSLAAVGFGGNHPQNMAVCCSKCGAKGPVYNIMREFGEEYISGDSQQFHHTLNKAVDAWNAIDSTRQVFIPIGARK